MADRDQGAGTWRSVRGADRSRDTAGASRRTVLIALVALVANAAVTVAKLAGGGELVDQGRPPDARARGAGHGNRGIRRGREGGGAPHDGCGPNPLLVAPRVDFASGLGDEDVEDLFERIDRRVREGVPDVTEVFLDATTAPGAGAEGARRRSAYPPVTRATPSTRGATG